MTNSITRFDSLKNKIARVLGTELFISRDEMNYKVIPVLTNSTITIKGVHNQLRNNFIVRIDYNEIIAEMTSFKQEFNLSFLTEEEFFQKSLLVNLGFSYEQYLKIIEIVRYSPTGCTVAIEICEGWR